MKILHLGVISLERHALTTEDLVGAYPIYKRSTSTPKKEKNYRRSSPKWLCVKAQGDLSCLGSSIMIDCEISPCCIMHAGAINGVGVCAREGEIYSIHQSCVFVSSDVNKKTERSSV